MRGKYSGDGMVVENLVRLCVHALDASNGAGSQNGMQGSTAVLGFEGRLKIIVIPAAHMKWVKW